MNEPQPSQKSFSSSSSSSSFCMTKREKYVAGVAMFLGVTVGVAIFAGTFGRLFTHSLEDWELRHNGTLDVLRDRLAMVTQEKEACLDDDAHALDLAAMRGKLAARSNLMQQYEELQREFEERGRRVEELTEETRLREEQHVEMKDTIDQQTTALLKAVEESNVIKVRVDRISEQRNGLTRQIKLLDSRVRELQKQVGDYERQTVQCKNRIQQRESFLCKEEYGMGPYYLQITAKIRATTEDDDSASLSFVVELASRRDMPHSVFTFLSMISYEMYDGNTTSLVVPEESDDDSHGRRMIVGLSDPVDPVFDQKRRAVGMQESILMFPETSPRFPCEEYSVGFHGLGPSLEFYLSPPLPPPSEEESPSVSCFGKVVRGFESLVSIQESVSNGKVVDITHIQHLLL